MQDLGLKARIHRPSEFWPFPFWLFEQWRDKLTLLIELLLNAKIYS
jgi:hypothetical protein